MIRIGLTGGIGSGKSTVGKLLNVYGFPVYVADEESKILTDSSPVIREKLNNTFSENLYPHGHLDKKRLAELIFSDTTKLHLVNNIIHPEVNKDFQAWSKQQQSTFSFIESAILYESGFNQYVDQVVMVYAPLTTRIERVMQRDGSTEQEVLKRIASQMPDEQKKELADHIILNDDLHALIPQVEQLLDTLHT